MNFELSKRRAKRAGFGMCLLLWCWPACLVFEGRALLAQTSNVPPFRISSVQVSGGVAHLNLNSATGCVYTLQGSDGSQGYWEDLTSQPGNGGVLSFSIPLDAASTVYFYRVAGVAGATLNLFPSGPVLGSGAVSLPDAAVLSPYNLDISPVSTGTSPYLLEFSGSLPTGTAGTVLGNHTTNALFRLSSAGTNLVAGQRLQFTLRVTDAAGASYSRVYDLRVIAPPPQILTTQVTLKTGATTNMALVATNGTPPFAWSLLSGAIPAGVSFLASGALSGTPTANASERYETGLYTNLVSLSDSYTDRVTGGSRSRVSSATLTTLVRLSFELNLVASRPEGPVLGGICVGCHGAYFQPDFTSGTALSVINVNAGSGGQCSGSWVYVSPGFPGLSLLYWKVSNPVCGNQMPYGGPYFDDVQINRVARWITELMDGDTD